MEEIKKLKDEMQLMRNEINELKVSGPEKKLSIANI